jgi:hypothetical protein
MESIDQKVSRYLNGDMSEVEGRTLLSMFIGFPSLLDSLSPENRDQMEYVLNA